MSFIPFPYTTNLLHNPTSPRYHLATAVSIWILEDKGSEKRGHRIALERFKLPALYLTST